MSSSAPIRWRTAVSGAQPVLCNACVSEVLLSQLPTACQPLWLQHSCKSLSTCRINIRPSCDPQVLSDPRQKRFFKSKDMRDLFTLGDQYLDAPETAAIFAGLDSEVALDPVQLARPVSATPQPAADVEDPAGNWGTAAAPSHDDSAEDEPQQDVAAGPGESHARRGRCQQRAGCC